MSMNLNTKPFEFQNVYQYGIVPIVVLSSFFVFFISIICLLFVRKLYKEQQKNKDLVQTQQAIVELYDTTRSFRHDFKNFILMLEGYCNESKFEAIHEIIQSQSSDIADMKLLECIPDIINISDAGLKWLLLSKYTDAMNKKILFTIQISPYFNISLISKNDLLTILGIVIDNAIDAANNANRKIVVFSMTNKENDTIISVKNTFEKKPNLTRIFDKNYSTKEKHEGLGLFKVKRIVNKYEDVYIDVKIFENFFYLDINISNSKLMYAHSK